MQFEDVSEVIDAKDMTLEEWLELMFEPPDEGAAWSWSFQTVEHRGRYLETMDQRSEEDVLRLLQRFLIPSGSLSCDATHFESLMWDWEKNPESYDRRIRLMYYRRLFRHSTGSEDVLPWEGNTWVLDLLPWFPEQALEGLEAHTLAHIQLLSAERLMGQYDAASIIRAKFIGLPGTQSERVEFLGSLSTYDFEHLIERLYRKMGYYTQFTGPSEDGRRDIIAHKDLFGGVEHLRIECKRYAKPVGVGIVRSLLGMICDEEVNRGVLATTSRFTTAARKLADRSPRLELLSGNEVTILMNEYLGSSWPVHIERLVLSSRRDHILRK
jgi:restriction system protein